MSPVSFCQRRTTVSTQRGIDLSPVAPPRGALGGNDLAQILRIEVTAANVFRKYPPFDLN